MSNDLERRKSDHLEGMDSLLEGARDLTPTYREEEQIIKKRVLAQRLLDEKRQLAEKGVGVLSDTYYDAKIAHRVAGDRTYRLLSDVEDEVQFKDDAQFYGSMDGDFDASLRTLCRATGDAVVGTLQSLRLPKDALLIRQEEEARESEEVAQHVPVDFIDWWRGGKTITYFR